MSNAQSEPRTVTLTPPAFDPSNPKAAENAKKANEAAKALEDVCRAKVDLLRDLREFFQQWGNDKPLHLLLMNALNGIVTHEDRPKAKADADELAMRWEALDNDHNSAGQMLHDAFTGR